MSRGSRAVPDPVQSTFTFHHGPRGTPDRAAAAREVEALLRRVAEVDWLNDEPHRLHVLSDGDYAPKTIAEFAALVVDAVLGQGET